MASFGDFLGAIVRHPMSPGTWAFLDLAANGIQRPPSGLLHDHAELHDSHQQEVALLKVHGEDRAMIRAMIRARLGLGSEDVRASPHPGQLV